MSDAAWVGIGTLVLNSGIALLTLGLGVGKVTRAIEKSMEAKFETHRTETDKKLDIIQERTGEMGAALRQKITDVEFYVRDNYVSSGTMDKIMILFGDNMRLQFESLKASLEEVKARLERDRV
jgi:hypothetical protein